MTDDLPTPAPKPTPSPDIDSTFSTDTGDTATAAAAPMPPRNRSAIDGPPDPQAGQRSPLVVAVTLLALIVVVGGVLLWRSGSTARDQVADLQNRIAALEARPPPPDLGPLEQRVAALEKRPQPDLRPLEQRLAALERRPPPEAKLDAAGQKQVADLAGRIDGIGARQDQLGTREQADMAKMSEQMGGLQQQVAASARAGSTVAAQAEKATSDVAAVTGRQAQLARLQAAAVALQAGRPLGDIPGAPPALAQFAAKPPPTESALRLSFDAAANAAREAGQPAKEGTPFFTRLWDRAQSGVTIREGDRVLVGDVVSGVLEHARRQLDAGDLPGAVSALDGLAGPAAAAMAPWRAQAQSLLDARAALLTAAHG